MQYFPTFDSIGRVKEIAAAGSYYNWLQEKRSPWLWLRQHKWPELFDHPPAAMARNGSGDQPVWWRLLSTPWYWFRSSWFGNGRDLEQERLERAESLWRRVLELPIDVFDLVLECSDGLGRPGVWD